MAGTMRLRLCLGGPQKLVSMESGLDGRNNILYTFASSSRNSCLNGVRPRWPEQWTGRHVDRDAATCLNGVRPRWPEQSLASEGRLD